jgi:hypothetical protein
MVAARSRLRGLGFGCEGRRRFESGDLVKLRQKCLMMLGQVTNHASVCQELGEKALGQN